MGEMRTFALVAAVLLVACVDGGDPVQPDDCDAPPPCEQSARSAQECAAAGYCTFTEIGRDGRAFTCSVDPGEDGCAVE